jgi:penicillin-binding protein 1C
MAPHIISRAIALAAAVAVTTVLVAPVGLKVLVANAEPPSIVTNTSVLVVDRRDRLLRPFPVEDRRWRLPVDVTDVEPLYLRMLLAYEDARFHRHHGVDVMALARAAWQVIRHGRAVSGGSTLTMQVVRLLGRQSTRDAAGKLRQILQALALERKLTKDEILALYFLRAPFGGNLEGVRSASFAYFGKEPRRLAPAEAALLVALPQSPEARRPDHDPEAARRARDRVLARALEVRLISDREAAEAMGEKIPTTRRPFPILSAHIADRVVAERPVAKLHRLTIDADLQRRMEDLALRRAHGLAGSTSVAILLADHRTGEILASVGSPDLFDEARDGFIDMTLAVRSPGSTLKPLIYGLAFELGIAHPETLIEDRPVTFAGYAPGNFEGEFYGTVTVRRALQLSLNSPAVQVLDAVGPARLLSRMRRAGAAPIIPSYSLPGLAIGLGGVGVTLHDLVAIYAAIARGGDPVPITIWPDLSRSAEKNPLVLDNHAAWQVGSILAGASRPQQRPPGTIAFKTGTSYGYRDAWAVGFDGRHVLGVWVGRPDGTPVSGLVGADAAAPILFDAFARLNSSNPLPGAPAGILVARTAGLPPPLRRFSHGRNIESRNATGPEIAFPPDGARVDTGFAFGERGSLALKLRRGTPPFRWFADGWPITNSGFDREISWKPSSRGFVEITVIDGQRRSARTRLFVE